jgi:glycosyltransferase involved in cell wall biosynthesis
MGIDSLNKIEAVDFVWQDGPLTELLPRAMLGKYDGLLASHVGEHLPDLIAFFQDASRILKESAVIALALPDKRVCFDFFQPLTTTGDLVEAHAEKRTRHRRVSFFNQAAYFVTRANEGGWLHSDSTSPFRLMNSLSAAQQVFDAVDENPKSAYLDTHAWTFTPKSFELLILELNLLGHINWAIRVIETTPGVEFHVWLEQRKLDIPEADINLRRLALLSAIVCESRSAIAQFANIPDLPPGAAPIDPPSEKAVSLLPEESPRIAVVIPLYNGAMYIEQTLDSVFRQTLTPAEIIVVNDGSIDDGAGVVIVERLAQSHPITLLHKTNGGQSSARNHGVRHSTSDLIAFLDQDDLWYRSHLEELAAPFKGERDPPLGWVYSDLDEVDAGGFLVCRSLLQRVPGVHPKRDIIECLGADMYNLPSASLVSRAAFEAVGGFDEQLCGYEDDDLFMRMFRLGYDSIYLEKSLSQWRIHTKSTTYTPIFERSRNIYIRKLLGMFPDDKQRGRHYARDLIVPRFLNLVLDSYEAAVLRNDPAATATAWKEAVFLLDYSSSVPARVVELASQRYAAALQESKPANADEVRKEFLDLSRNDEAVSRDLLPHAMHHYKLALLKGDRMAIQTGWQYVADIAFDLHKPCRRLRYTLNFLRNPNIARSAFAVRRIARPVMLWAFRV